VLTVSLFPFDLIHAIQGFIEKVLSANRADWLIRLAFCAESAHDKDDHAYQQNQANPAAADGGTTKSKYIQGAKIACRCNSSYGVFTPRRRRVFCAPPKNLRLFCF
jgi:hypothetical protein